jgi:hypothetical protein
MAKKAAVRTASQTEIRDDVEVVPTKAQKPSALLDTRVIYCGDNLEPVGQMQKEEGRMMKPALFPILHSSFLLQPLPLPASHYVKVMLDQIFGENNFQNPLVPAN